MGRHKVCTRMRRTPEEVVYKSAAYRMLQPEGVGTKGKSRERNDV